MNLEQPDYKDTLNLPKTAFPMKAGLAQSEPARIKFWQEMDIYKSMLQQRRHATKFVVADGPPYANGDIHIGHALNKILKDIIVKSKHLSGFQTPFIPGWDCHGLPIEHKVEQKVGKPGKKVDAQTFRQKCREYAQSQIEVQRKSFIRLGVLGDWDNYYSTMNYRFEANIMRTLAKVIAKGHLHREDRPVHWCLDCSSALAEAELEYKDKQSFSIDVAFPIVDAAAVAKLFAVDVAAISSILINVVIWTTTPWTLPANQAVTLHPDLTYVLVKLAAPFDQQLYIVAKDLLPAFLARIGKKQNDNQAENSAAELSHAPVADKSNAEPVQILGECLGKNLANQQLQHPFLERKVPIILGDHVTTDAGTGCVHTAPAHGYDDYVVCKQYGIVLENPVGANGCFFAEVPHVGGQPITTANTTLIELLTDLGALLSSATITHSYPHCWRHKTPLIFRATPQWFISMDKQALRAKSLQAIKDVTWIPTWGQARIEGMVTVRPDWCISRQRTWGTPMPLFIHKDSGEIHPKTIELIEQVAQKVEQAGIEAWHAIDSVELIGADAKDYIKSEDTLDVWFDSGAYHACVGEERPELSDPVDMYLEGSDQHRGWFQASLLSSVAVKQRAPYKIVLTHGFTIDTERRKMSKSLGNTLAPEQVMNTLGADVLRLWVAATDYRGDLNVSDEILKRTSDAYRRIRNTARFLLSNLDGFDPAVNLIQPQQMLALDRWIVARTAALQAEIIAGYEAFQFHLIYQQIHNFCVDELGSFYLDIIKDRQYTCKTDAVPRRSAQTAMYYVIEALSRWIAPILSFTAEEIWQHMPGKPESRAKSIFLTQWADNLPQIDSIDSSNAAHPGATLDNAFWQQIILIRTAVNKELEELRAAGIIGSGLEAEVDLYCDAQMYAKLAQLGAELRFVLIISQARLHQLAAAPNTAKATEVAGLKLMANKSSHDKCARCWHRCEDVNSNANYPNICQRCATNLTDGEQRIYA